MPAIALIHRVLELFYGLTKVTGGAVYREKSGLQTMDGGGMEEKLGFLRLPAWIRCNRFRRAFRIGLLFVAAFWNPGVLSAAPPPVIGQAGEGTNEGINHLEPIRPYVKTDDGTYYDQLVWSSVVTPLYPEVWMLVKPSFDPEYAVIVCSVEGPSGRPIAGKFEVRVNRATQKIWDWESDGWSSTTIHVKLHRNVKLNTAACEIPESAVKEIRKAWKHVILNTRYADGEYLRFDGTTYEFFVRPDYFGGTFCPGSGVPAMMVKLGETLILYVNSQPQDRQKRLDDCLRLAKELQTHQFR